MPEPPLSSAAARSIRRAVAYPLWLLFPALAIPFAAGLDLTGRLGWLQYIPFAASLLLFGLPHGAADHLVPGRLTGRGASANSVAAVVLLYLGLGGTYLALWTVAPTACFVLFIALTWFHWGQGDVYASRTFLGVGRSPAGLGVLVRGGLPMLIPLLAFPREYAALGESLIALFGHPLPAPSAIFHPLALAVCGLVFLALATVYLVRVLQRNGALSCAVEAWEVTVLGLYFVFVPPVLAIGIYFCLWHSTRHIFRLALLDGPSAAALDSGRILPALVRFATDAAPLTLVALVFLAGLYRYLPSATPYELLAGYLVFVSALTLPHVVLVSWMDARQELWRK